MSQRPKHMHWFYPIFDNAQLCEELVPLGIKFLQLRMKDKPDAELRAQLRDVLQICDAHNCTLVLNDYWKLAIEEGCTWLHLGQEDLAEADLAAIKSAGLKFGLSTHDNNELETALSTQPNYVALGPVYPTILKKMKWTEQGLGKVAEWKKILGDMPLVGIGGLSVERAPGVLEAGADMVSVVTDITLNKDPKSRVEQWLSIQK